MAFRLEARNESAVFAIRAIGLDPKFIADVLKQIDRPDSREDAVELHRIIGAQLLSATGKDGAAGLAGALANPSLTVRLAAIGAIQIIGEPVKTDAIERKLNVLVQDDRTRWDAALALVDIGTSAKEAIPGLMKDLEKGRIVPLEAGTRYVCPAVDVLLQIPEAIPDLLSGLHNTNYMVRFSCAVALQVDPALCPEFGSALRAMLAEPDFGMKPPYHDQASALVAFQPYWTMLLPRLVGKPPTRRYNWGGGSPAYRN